MRVAVVYKKGSEEVAKNVEDFLRSRVEVSSYTSPFPELEEFDALVIVGGDGTVLRTVQEIKEVPPTFVVNTGRVGIFSHANADNFEERLGNAIEKMEIESFMRIEAKVKGSILRALNEISILTHTPSRLLRFEVLVDGEKIEEMRSDGMIFSTPLGSTAYNLSSGGPIVDPKLEAVVITPVSPFRLGWRSWVIGAERGIAARVDLREAVVVADGQKSIVIEPGEVVEIRKSKYPVKFFKIERRLERVSKKVRELM